MEIILSMSFDNNAAFPRSATLTNSRNALIFSFLRCARAVPSCRSLSFAGLRDFYEGSKERKTRSQTRLTSLLRALLSFHLVSFFFLICRCLLPDVYCTHAGGLSVVAVSLYDHIRMNLPFHVTMLVHLIERFSS